jgi:hypothetical protein
MNTKSAPRPAPEDLAAERLSAAVESAIGVIQKRLANLADDNQDAKWSVSDLVRLLQLRNQLQGERPRTICAYWVDDPPRSRGAISIQRNIANNNDQDDPKPDTRAEI